MKVSRLVLSGLIFSQTATVFAIGTPPGLDPIKKQELQTAMTLSQSELAKVETLKLKAQTLGQQLAILDVRKETIEKYVSKTGNSLLLLNLHRIGSAALPSIGTVFGTSLVVALIGVPVGYGLMQNYEQSTFAKKYKEFQKRSPKIGRALSTAGLVAGQSAAFALFLGPAIYIGYFSYHSIQPTINHQQLIRLNTMTEDQIAMEYESVLQEAIQIGQQLKQLAEQK